MNSRRILGLTVAACLWVLPAAAEQFGMVVGVDDYKNFQPHPAPRGELSDLEGAVNDAQLIADAMRKSGITLPQTRVLINADATVKNFLSQWRAIISQAKPGDTIIVSFSGHGGQEKEVSAPFDETTDGLDETIMFHEFDPKNSRIGRLSDDQLQLLLAEAAAFNVIWVMDSCHSAGLTRSVDMTHMGLTRSGGVWDIPLDPIEDEIRPATGDDNADPLPHVTQILATASEDRLVTETRFDGNAHGALSWFFAKALEGAADLDTNGSVTRGELAGFLQDRVFDHMNQTQQPRVLPRGDTSEAFTLTTGATTAVTPLPDPAQVIPVKIIGTPPPGLEAGSYMLVNTSPMVTFEQTAGQWRVLNHTGDQITTLTTDAGRMINRAQALQDVRASKRATLPPVIVKTAQTSTTHAIGQIVGFTFVPPSAQMSYLSLFNIASDGALQFLHPLSADQNTPVAATGFDVRFRVSPPTGADQLVAVFCSRPPLELQAVLRDLNGQTAPREDRLSVALRQGRCQIGLTGLFTHEE